jgi:hypothetical protein
MSDGSGDADQEWSWKDFIPVAPMIAGAFAFAYVVGYFLAFDISWFPFFTLSEHIVFALRALPVAIGISIAFLIVFELTRISQREGWLKKYLGYAWILVLVGTAIGIFLYNHAGLALTLLFIAVSTFLYYRGPDIRSPLVTFLFSATNMMLVSVIVGVLSGATWRVPSLQPDSRAMAIKLKNATGNPIRGHVIFAGNQSVLIYEFGSGVTHLVSWENIEQITEGPAKAGE